MFENNTLEKKFFENLYFLVSYVFSVSKLILWYLNMSTIDLATWFKIGMYLLDREKRLNAFLRSTNKIQVLNEWIVPQFLNLRPKMAKSIVFVITLITNRNHAFNCFN